jgi:hypothetical protein
LKIFMMISIRIDEYDMEAFYNFIVVVLLLSSLFFVHME